jgi:D-glycero-beta-D-manno-heptose-7-phosphate kinase
VSQTVSPGGFRQIVDGMQKKRIIVIGDIMLDQYFWGSVSRVSPEAPVPVVDVESDSVRLGGAANVAHNLASLGADALLIGIIGRDQNGAVLSSLMRDSGFSTEGLIEDPSRPTTIKTRIIAHDQHVVRFDRERTDDVSSLIERRIIDVLNYSLESADGIILQDYNKGVCTAGVIRAVTSAARESQTIVTVDPKFRNFFEYRDVTVFKPNRRELEQACGRKLSADADFELAGSELLRRLNAGNVLVTRGENGMTLVEGGGIVSHFPTRTRSAADVSGAGDTVIATLTAALAAGADIGEAAELSNYAAGIVCGEVGIVPVERQRLLQSVLHRHSETAAVTGSGEVRNG